MKKGVKAAIMLLAFLACGFGKESNAVDASFIWINTPFKRFFGQAPVR